MRRMLVVGCGGSGGRTLRYIMDQLRADLKAGGAGDTIPGVWQFVHIDAPLSEEEQPSDLRSVTGHNSDGRVVGSYAAIGGQANFRTVYTSVMERLRSAAGSSGQYRHVLRDNTTWTPRSEQELAAVNHTPLSEGAGQIRMVGRMLTLNSLDRIDTALRAARDRIFTDSAEREALAASRAMDALGEFDISNNQVITLVVGSMAGGSGASMLLDVCRVLGAGAALGGSTRAVFAYGAEVFGGLDRGARTGMNGNTLAMLAEMAALQTGVDGVATRRETETFGALGIPVPGDDPTFSRVFPIGLSQGVASRSAREDSDPNTVFRRLGRGVARLMGSAGALEDFVAYTLGNPESAPGDRRFIGWGAASDPLAWAGFGYASLAMGRDRYREYAAQRLARGAVDRLLSGHVDPVSSQDESEQLAARIAHNRSGVFARCGIPEVSRTGGAPEQVAANWLSSEVAGDRIAGEAQRSVASLREGFPENAHGDTLEAIHHWYSEALSGTGHRRDALEPTIARLTSTVQEVARDFTIRFEEGMLEEVKSSIGTHGLVYASAVVELLCGSDGRGGELQALARGLRQAATSHRPDLAEVPASVREYVTGLRGQFSKRTKEVVGAGAMVVDHLDAGLHSMVAEWLYKTLADTVAEVLSDFCLTALLPLRAELRDALVTLRNDVKDTATSAGVALYSTDRYLQWPDEAAVPSRFSEAHNEVVITESSAFPAQFERDVIATNREDTSPTYTDAQARLIREIVTGTWDDVSGATAPDDLLLITQRWVTGALPDLSATGLGPRPARFQLRAATRDVLGRALQFVDRPGEAFDIFIRQDIKGYLEDSRVAEHERGARSEEVRQKFLSTLRMSEPMIAVDSKLVHALHHGAKVLSNYKFSPIPFAGLPVGQQIFHDLSEQSAVSPSTTKRLHDQVQQPPHGSFTRVDVFGTYENYLPLVFRSVVEPVQKEWVAASAGVREVFGRHRRTRSLAGYLPVGEQERHAMIRGWWVGQALSLVKLPPRDTIAPAQVWDLAKGKWQTFPWPMLTPPDRFKWARRKDEWLPAVLETLPLAWLNMYPAREWTFEDNPLRAFQALRALADDSVESPSSGITPRAQRLLEDWLRDGKTPSGDPSRIPGLPPEGPGLDLAAQRRDAITTWAQELRARYEERYVEPGNPDGFGGLADTSRIFDVTITADIADDCITAFDTLIDYVQDAWRDVERSPGGKQAQHVGAKAALDDEEDW